MIAKDGTVTVRYRNDGKQERIKITDAKAFIKRMIGEGKVSL